MKIAWLCSFSNVQVREHLDMGIPKILLWMYKVARGHEPFTTSDFGVWNTNAIKEFEKCEEVELHVISPCSFLRKRMQEFELNRIHYHFFRDESSCLCKMVYKQITNHVNDSYNFNRHAIKGLIKKIKPDIVHIIGAENPRYSLALLDVPSTIPTIVQLQTLINDPEFKSNFPIDESSYKYLSEVENKVIQRADYIGTAARKFIKIILERIRPNACIINLNLAVAENISPSHSEKLFDFVYFASNINKACDVALEAFGLAHQQNPSITLNIVGGYTESFKLKMDAIVDKYGLNNVVTFQGLLPTHEDVLKEISKARLALLPLKIDLTSGTIREAMYNGLPVLTTDTGELGTQLLNNGYQCALISPKSDIQSLASNMLLLLKDKALCESLRQNAFRRLKEELNNEVIVRDYINAYKQILGIK